MIVLDPSIEAAPVEYVAAVHWQHDLIITFKLMKADRTAFCPDTSISDKQRREPDYRKSSTVEQLGLQGGRIKIMEDFRKEVDGILVVVEGKRVRLPAGCSAVEEVEAVIGEAEETEEGDSELFKENEQRKYWEEKVWRKTKLWISKRKTHNTLLTDYCLCVCERDDQERLKKHTYICMSSKVDEEYVVFTLQFTSVPKAVKRNLKFYTKKSNYIYVYKSTSS